MEGTAKGGVRIAEKMERGLALHTTRLKQLLNKSSISELPLVIIAIAGEARKGKSFIMNFFIRYLMNKGFDGNDWMQVDEPVGGGFAWRGGMDHVTDGILMWDEPFIIQTDTHGQVAVLFVDTQGLFTGTEKTVDTKIFALSVLMSSCFIFNLQEDVDTRDLEFVEYFSSFAKRCFSWEEDTAPFQRLTFLVRDWTEYPYGCEEGKKYIDELSRNHRTIGQISRYFKEVDCFLMPHPGDRVDRGSKVFTDIDGKFVSHLQPLMDFLLHPSRLAPKLVDGKIVMPSFLLSYADTCFKQLEAVEAKTLTEISRETDLLSHTHQFEEIYKDAMNKVLDSSFVPTETDLEILHNDSLRLSQEYLEKQNVHRGEVREALTEIAKHLYEDYRNRNKANRAKARNLNLKLVDEVIEEFNDGIKKRCEHILDEADLAKVGEELKAMALEKYVNDKRSHPIFHGECKQILVRGMQTSFEDAKKRNTERKEEQKLKEEEKRLNDLVKNCLQHGSDEFDKIAKMYAEKPEFETFCDDVERMVVEEFQANLTSTDGDISTKYGEKLRSELKACIKRASVRNAMNKEILIQRMLFFEIHAGNIHREAMAECTDECYFTERQIEKIHAKIRDGLLSVLTEDHFPCYSRSEDGTAAQMLTIYRVHLGNELDSDLPLQQVKNYINIRMWVHLMGMTHKKGNIRGCDQIVENAAEKFKNSVAEACEVVTVLNEFHEAFQAILHNVCKALWGISGFDALVADAD